MNEVHQFDDGLEAFGIGCMEHKDIYQDTELPTNFLNSQSCANICNGFTENINEHFAARDEPQIVYPKSGKTVFPVINTNQTEISAANEPTEECSETDIIQNDFFNSDSTLDNKNKPVGMENAARERSRVKTLRGAFLELQRTLPAVPPDTKLSKLDVLVLATTYIAHLMRTLNDGQDDNQLFAAHGIMHPVKKWPMRSRLYAGILSSTFPVSSEITESSVPWTQRSSRREKNRRKTKSHQTNHGQSGPR